MGAADGGDSVTAPGESGSDAVAHETDSDLGYNLTDK